MNNNQIEMDGIVANWVQAIRKRDWNHANHLRQKLLIEHNATLMNDPNKLGGTTWRRMIGTAPANAG